MKVTYLGHSGFLVQTASAHYLFDYIRGELPPFSDDLPLYVFASHFHGDHFDPRIFTSELQSRVARYILGNDIRQNHMKSCKPFLDQISFVQAGKTITPEPAVPMSSASAEQITMADFAKPRPFAPEILCLESNDSGVAFVVKDPEGAIYHAGDLNWWHWEGEPDSDNEFMATSYCHEINKLKDIPIAVAFVPLDPRLEDAFGYGLEYFLKTVTCPHVFPMHFWEDYTVIPAFTRRYGYTDRVHKLKTEGETFII